MGAAAVALPIGMSLLSAQRENQRQKAALNYNTERVQQELAEKEQKRKNLLKEQQARQRALFASGGVSSSGGGSAAAVQKGLRNKTYEELANDASAANYQIGSAWQGEAIRKNRVEDSMLFSGLGSVINLQ